MFDQIISPDNFTDAYQKTQRGSPSFHTDAIRFARNETHNLEHLRQELVSGQYKPRRYIEFSVYEPKERIIYAPQYRDKIAQHAVNNVLREFYEPKFIFDSYACIRGKGNQRAVLRVQQHLRRAWLNFTDPWIVKADVQKFFYSIVRSVVKGLLAEKLVCQRTLELLFRIIDSSPGEQGLPLGNLTSQLLANVLMNEVDHYIKRRLGVRHYVRYADDLVLVVDGKAQAGDVLGCIQSFGRDVLQLTFPARKSFIRPLCPRRGTESLGYRITPKFIGLTSRAKSIFIQRLAGFDKLLQSHRILPGEVRQSLTSWYSYAGLAGCQRFVEEACRRTQYIRFGSDKKFHISMNMRMAA